MKTFIIIILTSFLFADKSGRISGAVNDLNGMPLRVLMSCSKGHIMAPPQI